VNQAIACRHATLWSFHHTFTLTCVRPVVIVGWNALDVYFNCIGSLLRRSSREIGQFMFEGELHRAVR
jgi:hypothetical protein